ncbi:UNVERIFIED_ORG: FlaA1/EpsC-like NDP-sugar epimerase [Shinella zoogloeoides]|nr:FlaA1/EpsC-like NDP-sugar epimerase [Shinella zoogloeoides]
MYKEQQLAAIATGRKSSLFAEDFDQQRGAIGAALRGRRVLALGGCGSIGSSTIRRIASFAPAALHVVDHDENGLAELVRQFRSQAEPLQVADLRTLPLDYGSAAFRFFLASQPTYDLVLNFAALKHVRSEKDPYSALQMFETNLIKQMSLMDALAKTGFSGRLFTVSTDKAANPSSMMGASKRAMEHVMFNSSESAQVNGVKTSARFANVAFSNGSLLQSFEHRLTRSEPLAAPAGTKRYFVSMEEAGEICTLASLIAPDRHIVVPKLDPQAHLVEMQHIAERFLEFNGFEPAYYSDEAAACRNVSAERARRRWPLIITALDTAGEKPYEEFIAKGEEAAEIGFAALQAVKYLAAPRDAIDSMLSDLMSILNADSIDLSKEQLKMLLAKVEPAFLASHRDSALNLDQRA